MPVSDVFDWDAALNDAENDTSDYSQPIPAGDYKVKVLEASAGHASTGSPMIKLKMEVIDDPQYGGRWLWTNLIAKPDSPGSAKMFAKKILGFGLTPEWLSANKPSMQAIATALVGRQAIAPVTVKEYKGKPGNEAGVFKAIAGQPSPGAVGVPAAPGVPSVPQPAPAAPPAPPAAPAAPAAAAPAAGNVQPPLPPVPPAPVVGYDTDEEPF